MLAVPTIALALAKAVFKDNLHMEFHDGQLHVEWVPVSGTTCGAEAVEVRARTLEISHGTSIGPLAHSVGPLAHCMQVRLCGDRRGYGCFAVQRIGCGTYLGDYEGELLDEGEFWARYPDGTVTRPPSHVLTGGKVARCPEHSGPFTTLHTPQSVSPA